MKKLLLVLLFVIQVTYSQNIENYYYYEGQKIYLDIQENQIAVTIAENMTSKGTEQMFRQTLGNLFQESKIIITGKRQLAILNHDLPEADLLNLIDKMNERSEIMLASPVLRNNQVRQAITNEFIVKFSNNAKQENIDNLNNIYSTNIVKKLDESIFVMSVDKFSGINGLIAANIYYESGLTDWAEPNFTYLEWELLNATVNDPYWTSQWPHVNTGQTVVTGASYGPSTVNGTPDADMDVDLAWDALIASGGSAGGSSSIIVAIIDSGTDLDHPDLDANALSGADYSSDGYSNGNNSAGSAHGTCCSGVVAAEGNNATGVAGIAYNSLILPVKIFNDAGSSSGADIAGAINYAWNTGGADILSNSWGGGSVSSAINTAINNAKTSGRGGLGSIILFSSGNDGHDPCNYPSYLSDVIAVGASSMFDEKKNPGSGDQQHWWGGNYGDELDIVAPTICYTTDIAGTSGYSTTDYLDDFNGTSAACPNAAGVTALILAANSSLTSDQVQDILQSTADKIEKYEYNSSGWNEHVGYGRVNAYRAVQAALGYDGEVPLHQHSLQSPVNTINNVTISADINDNSGIASGSAEPLLYYRTDSGSGFGSWNFTNDTNGPTGSTYEFLLPGQPWDTQVEYYIASQDNSTQNNITSYPFGAYGVNPPGTYATANPFTYRVGNLSTQQYTQSTSSTINSSGTSTSTLAVTDSRIIADINIEVDLSHTYDSDINIMIQSPSGTRCGLASEYGGSGNNYSVTLFDDEASSPISSGSPPFNGAFQPDNGLWIFDGENIQGTWTLYVYDGYAGDGGTFNSWRINVTYASVNQIPTAAASSDINQGYPDLTVNFNGSGSNDSDGSISSYSWDFGDGSTSDQANPQHTYTTAGKFDAVLTVTDNGGAADSDNITITVDADLSKLYISEVSDATSSESEYLEIYNDNNYDVDLKGCKIIQDDGALLKKPTEAEYIFDFGVDESSTGTITIISPKRTLIVSRGASQSQFESTWGTLPVGTGFNSGNGSLQYGESTSKRWIIRYFDGTPDTDDGSLIDDSGQPIAGSGNRTYQNSVGSWSTTSSTFSSPGSLDGDQSLPVSLVSFTALAKDKLVELKWETKSEVDNLGFIILRSLEKENNFEELATYKSDKELEGEGNSPVGKKYCYVDKAVFNNVRYWYKLVDVDIRGIRTEHKVVTAKPTMGNGDLIQVSSFNLPKEFALKENFPNPFNPSTKIPFDIPEKVKNEIRVKISVYDVLGRMIKDVFDGFLTAGTYQLVWDGTNLLNQRVPSGVYIYSITTNEFNKARKMILVQ